MKKKDEREADWKSKQLGHIQKIFVHTCKEFSECVSFEMENVILVLPKWHKYGLSLDYGVIYEKGGLEEALKRHELVSCFLDTNRSIRKKYKRDQSGDPNYYDILSMAEKKAEKKLNKKTKDVIAKLALGLFLGTILGVSILYLIWRLSP
jgi:hypothetical protein